MRAILLAAGLGTRLRPITDSIPKCLVPINGIPLIDIWFELLFGGGIERVLVNLHHKAELVQDHIHCSKYAAKVDLSYEPCLLGTAGTLIANKSYLGESDGLLVHADNYSRINIEELVDRHSSRPDYCLMTMLAFRTRFPESCGILEVDHDGVLQEMYEKSKVWHGDLANGATYVLSRQLILALNSESDFCLEVIPKFLGKIFVVETKMPFVDIGTPESLEIARSIEPFRD